MIPDRPTNVIAFDEVRSWLAEHGVGIDQTINAVIRVDRARGDIGAWLDVTYYLRDDSGGRFFDPVTGEAATASASIPLTRFPQLTPV